MGRRFGCNQPCGPTGVATGGIWQQACRDYFSPAHIPGCGFCVRLRLWRVTLPNCSAVLSPFSPSFGIPRRGGVWYCGDVVVLLPVKEMIFGTEALVICLVANIGPVLPQKRLPVLIWVYSWGMCRR